MNHQKQFSAELVVDKKNQSMHSIRPLSGSMHEKKVHTAKLL